MLILAAVLLAMNFALTKFYQKNGNNTNYEILIFNAITATFSGLIFFGINGFKVDFKTFSVCMSALFTMLVFTYQIIGFKIMARGKIAIYTMFLMSGGMILPYLWGVFFLEEEISLLRSLGLIVILLSLLVSNLDEMKLDFKLFIMCAAVFVLNGFVSIISKTHQINDNAVSTNDFVIINNLFSALSGYLIAFSCRKTAESKKRQPIRLKHIIIIFMVAATSGISSFLQLKGAQNIPASVLYPVITGGTVLFTAIAGRIFFKEKGSLKLNIGLVMCFVGTCMFL